MKAERSRFQDNNIMYSVSYCYKDEDEDTEAILQNLKLRSEWRLKRIKSQRDKTLQTTNKVLYREP
jgi:hypothetical protein